MGLVRTRPTKEEMEKNTGLRWFVPVHGLTGLGCEAAKHYEMGGARPFEAERSLLTLEHELKQADTQFALEQLCEKQGWKFFAAHNDLYRTVEPDRLFGIDKGNGMIPLFYEEENRKKDFQDLYVKARRYHDYFNTEKCAKDWGWFKTFHVLWQFPNEERMTNFVRFLAGECDCRFYRGKIKHTCLAHGLQEEALKAPGFWFTHDELTKDIGGRIWITPANASTHSFDDL
jgi:hypothetical protein